MLDLTPARDTLDPIEIASRDEIAAHLDTLETQASRFEEKRAARAARLAATR